MCSRMLAFIEAWTQPRSGPGEGDVPLPWYLFAMQQCWQLRNGAGPGKMLRLAQPLVAFSCRLAG